MQIVCRASLGINTASTEATLVFLFSVPAAISVVKSCFSPKPSKYRTDPSFDPRTYGFAKLSDLVKAQPFVETRNVKGASGQGQLWVRLKGRTPAKKAAKATQA